MSVLNVVSKIIKAVSVLFLGVYCLFIYIVVYREYFGVKRAGVQTTEDWIPCTADPQSNDCLVLDRVQLQQVGVALQSLPKYWCPSAPANPDDMFCYLTEGSQKNVAWFNTVPGSITIRRLNGAVKYVELFYTYSEFDRLVEPMREHFGEPTTTQMVPYRNNVAPSRSYVWESSSATLQLFDNSASTSVQITIK